MVDILNDFLPKIPKGDKWFLQCLHPAQGYFDYASQHWTSEISNLFQEREGEEILVTTGYKESEFNVKNYQKIDQEITNLLLGCLSYREIYQNRAIFSYNSYDFLDF